ncbi:SlyX family protein [Botrimarina mediterranea]|uniref:Protein SlyX n=1 Tax=Botrimarina mediterranea TaxID=2528022 RepID=A0A518K5D9_9BACT|nr:SlyX family protein [Botrimarina mediterranea]QDV73010.1 Protein SlyX [Botrimarina mediterranea]QDV77584.1 Protein SlyX [Planctomycetes bacterium K2D]
MSKLLAAAGLLGATAVGLGAYAAHGLDDALAGFGYAGDELTHRVDNFVTASRYQLTTAAAVLAIALAGAGRPLLAKAAWLLVAGVVVFSGLLYVLAFVGDGMRWLGAIVLLGGLAMIVGWLLAGFAAFTPSKPSGSTESRDLAAELNRLQEVISHQQQLVNDLNEAVTAARDEVDATARRQHGVELTVRRLVDLQTAAEDLPDEKPPHY